MEDHIIAMARIDACVHRVEEEICAITGAKTRIAVARGKPGEDADIGYGNGTRAGVGDDVFVHRGARSIDG